LPAPRIAPQYVSLSQLWLDASFVAMGSLSGIRRVGGTRTIPLTNGGSVSVYGCRAVFTNSSVIKGHSRGDAVLWFSYSADCTPDGWPYQKIQNPRRAWFLRQDQTWLRPVFDNGALYLAVAPDESGGDPADIFFARTMLVSSALADSGSANRLREVYSLATEIVGEDRALQILAEIQRTASTEVRAQICRLLATDYDQCVLSECPVSSASAAGSADLKRLRRAHELDSISPQSVAAVVASGSEPRMGSLHRTLRLLACNPDPHLKARAIRLLREHFPSDSEAPCAECR
jgi:hypothetical protein